MNIAPHKVSVIIPNYNHSRYLPQRVESVLNQNYKNIDVIILDDCSPDNSRDIIEYYAAQDPRISVVYNEKNSGSTFKQWNKGFSLSKGEYIWIAESDDFAELNLLEKLVAKLDDDSSIGLAYCNSTPIDENGCGLDNMNHFYSDLDSHLWTKDFVVDGRSLIKDFMSYRNIIPNASAVVIRKSAIDRVGKANENYKINGDWVFWAAVMANNKVAFVADKLNYFRFHLNNVRSKTLNKGLALNEMTSVIRVMKEYGKPNPIFLNRILHILTDQWFDGMTKNRIPLRTSLNIYKNMQCINDEFNQYLFIYTKKYFVKKIKSILRID